jgi:hypothetical protein
MEIGKYGIMNDLSSAQDILTYSTYGELIVLLSAQTVPNMSRTAQ